MLKNLAKKVQKKYKQTVAIPGQTDIIVVHNPDQNQYKSTPFTLNFGISCQTNPTKTIHLKVNNNWIKNTKFRLDQLGNLDPIIPTQDCFRDMGLRRGRNFVEFVQEGQEGQEGRKLECQVYLYGVQDRIIVSDLDGTLTKSDFYGIVNNLIHRHHAHNGYIDFIQKASNNGYQIIWLTMRSINLYNLSKSYISKHTKTPGPLLPWPERILSSLKKQLTKNTIDPKLFLLRNIRELFPEHVNPFVGALGNRENDALAYTAAEVPLGGIFLVDHLSIVQRWGCHEKIDYSHMSEQIQHYFPKLTKTSIIELPKSQPKQQQPTLNLIKYEQLQ